MKLSTEEKKTWKQAIKAACIALLEKRLAISQLAMDQAQESANSDDKSSAGDKYETGRAMGQRDRDMHAAQYNQCRDELNRIQTLDTETPHERVGTGSVVLCGEQVFFVALGLGTLIVEGRKIVVLSPQAPLAVLMKLKTRGDQFQLNGRDLLISDVF
jgi:hypothetical protein